LCRLNVISARVSVLVLKKARRGAFELNYTSGVDLMSQILPLIRRLAENNKARFGEGRLEKFFVFKFGSKVFAVPAVDVTEVVIPGSLISVPQQSELIMGVVNIRGTVVPVVNLRKRVGLEPEYQIGEDSRLMVFTLKPGSYVAMVADDIEYRLKDGILSAMPEELALSEEKSFRNAMIDDTRHHVFFIDQWLTKEEIKILQQIVESF
jgi:purine-binding chemotaxis protein CheW